METKQKTWEDCLNEVAKKKNYPDWKEFFNWICRDNEYPSSVGIQIEEAAKKAAELFNSSTAEERDALQKELADTQINLSTVEEENERLKHLSDSWGTVGN